MPRKAKPLNPDRIKGVSMFLFSLPIALLSGITGIGAQIAMAPMITYMLGFIPERTLGTSLYFTLWTAIGGVAGAIAGGLPGNFATALLVAFGGTVGVVMTVGLAQKPNLRTPRRVAQSLLFVVLILIIQDANRLGGMSPLNTPYLHNGTGHFAIGVLAGIVSNLFQAPMGVLLIPGLIYLGGTKPSPAILISLIVTLIACILPTLGHVQRQTVDGKIGRWLAVSGLAGGICGGLLLAHFSNGHIPIMIYAGCAAVLAAWSVVKLL
jgi:uncharacterized membrane protein YfcA